VFETATVAQITIHDLKCRLEEKREFQLIDMRRPAEYTGCHAPTAVNAQLAELGKRIRQFDPQAITAVICAGGYRSMAGTSILAQHGFHSLYNITGGTDACVEVGYPVEGAEVVTSGQH
jgi:rhodanese-related sulfurtransferase